MDQTISEAKSQLTREYIGQPVSGCGCQPPTRKVEALVEALLHAVDADPLQKGEIGYIDGNEMKAAKTILEATPANQLQKGLDRCNPERMRARWNKAAELRTKFQKNDESVSFRLGKPISLVPGMAPKACLKPDPKLIQTNECSGEWYSFERGARKAVEKTIAAWKAARNEGRDRDARRALRQLYDLTNQIFDAIEADFFETPVVITDETDFSTPLTKFAGTPIRELYQKTLSQEQYKGQLNEYIDLLNSIYTVMASQEQAFQREGSPVYCGWPISRLDAFRDPSRNTGGSGSFAFLLPYMPDYLWNFLYLYNGCIFPEPPHD